MRLERVGETGTHKGPVLLSGQHGGLQWALNQFVISITDAKQKPKSKKQKHVWKTKEKRTRIAWFALRQSTERLYSLDILNKTNRKRLLLGTAAIPQWSDPVLHTRANETSYTQYKM